MIICKLSVLVHADEVHPAVVSISRQNAQLTSDNIIYDMIICKDESSRNLGSGSSYSIAQG